MQEREFERTERFKGCEENVYTFFLIMGREKEKLRWRSQCERRGGLPAGCLVIFSFLQIGLRNTHRQAHGRRVSSRFFFFFFALSPNVIYIYSIQTGNPLAYETFTQESQPHKTFGGEDDEDATSMLHV